MIYPLLREWGCGHANMVLPRLLQPRLGGRDVEDVPIGRNRVVIDVGIGSGANETLEALRQGFVVFAFDPDAGNIANLRAQLQANASLADKFKVIDVVPGQSPDTGTMPEPPAGGFVFILNAGLSSSTAAASLQGAADSGQVVAGAGSVPLITLDTSLPSWATKNVYLLKVDTQGYELRVLKGALNLLQSMHVRYVLFEYSPVLMKRGQLGEPLELLGLLPSLGYTCFDMMGEHIALPRPSSIPEFHDMLWHWRRWKSGQQNPTPPESDPYGPWEEIMCASFQQHDM
jgi:FkbM family methyltransferase